MIKVSGMSVFPAEVELILNMHPAVEKCGVIGVAYPEKGEVPLAFVQIGEKYKGNISAADLLAWCKERISPYKVPDIIFREDLPITSTGKVMKGELRELLSAYQLKNGG